MPTNTVVGYTNVIPLIQPVDKTSSAWASPWVDLKTAHELRFFCFFGSMTATSSDETITLTVECACEAGSDSEAAIAFNYRISGAVGANTWGAVTAATTTGVAAAITEDNKIYEIQVDPAVAANGNTNKNGRWVRLVGSVTASITADVIAVWAELDTRYKQTTFVSATGAT